MEKYEQRLAELAARSGEIAARLNELDAVEELTDEHRAEYDALLDEGPEVAEERAKVQAEYETRQRILAAAEKPATSGAGAPEYKRSLPDPYEDELEGRAFNVPASELRGRALKAVETADKWEMDDDARNKVANLLERHDDRRGTIAQMVLSTGSRAYKEAWTKAITGRTWALTPKEAALLERGMEARAMSQTDAEGGFAIPFPIDPQLIVTGDGSTNPFRQIGRVVPITADSWQGISAGAVSASFDAEAAEVSDDAPTWAQPQVVAHMARAFIPASIEISQDYPNLASDLLMLFAEGKNDLETTAFSTGSGTNQPFGIVTAIDGTGNDTATATTDVYAVADVRTVFETLGPRYRSRASWVMNVGIINDTVAFGTDALATQTLNLADSPVGLSVLGRPVYESSAMDGVVNATQENNIVVFGDFSHYLIADRVGGAVEYIPHLFATNANRPSGQRGWFYYWRVGADSVNDDAFVLLNAT